ncbi:hypothetical protein GGS20DRAFT_585602 [Poronia punctata]|nr:hypothetical protein GGS20DRAFT_585602 [Poronia punctata]
MAEMENALDTAVRRLLQQNQLYEAGPDHSPEELDQLRIRQLNVENTSGDTFITVKFPAGDFLDCNGFQWETKEFLMNSEELLATGSTVFARLLSPEVQWHAKRRHRHPRNDLPASVRFCLDLTPSMEGEDSAYQVTQLSLSQGVRDWWRSYPIWQAASGLVSGHDDHCPNHFDIPLSDLNRSKTISPTYVDIDDLKYPDWRQILDYCPIRHRVAILRLLLAISRKELVLNSAPRVVTITAVAHMLDCTQVVKDSVLSWFLAGKNYNFIGINAEDAFKIAWTLQLPFIARLSFQVLVVEEAIEILQDPGDGGQEPRRSAKHSLFGRARGSITEEQETCIQHAAQKLAGRAEELWRQLNSADVDHYLGIEEWPSHDRHLCDGLRTCIYEAVASAATATSISRCSIEYTWAPIDRERAHYVPGPHRESTRDIYRRMSPAQLILTPYFWTSLTHLVGDRPNFLKAGRTGSFPLEPLVPEIRDETTAAVASSDDETSFDVETFLDRLEIAILELKRNWIRPEFFDVPVMTPGPMIFGLSEDEYNFLPLWAGGLDDGTGGVYQTEVPDADRGFPIGPGPAFRTGETIIDGGDYASTLGDDTATITTGTGTVTMTEGRSLQPAPSQSIITAESMGGFTLASTTAPSPAPQQNTDMATTARSVVSDDFDWSSEVFEELDLGSDTDDTDDESWTEIER